MESNIKLEEVQALYFDKDAFKETGIELRRLDNKGQRNYYSLKDNEVEWVYTSVTTFIKQVLPTSPYLMDYMRDKSKEEQEAILKSSSTYGTLMDMLFCRLLIDGTITDIYTTVAGFIAREGVVTADVNKWVDSLKKDCLSFCQWVKDYEVKPLLVSCPLASKALDIAGTLDLYCEMNSRMPTKTIKPKRVRAIVDFKAKIGDMSEDHSRGSFYSGECLQLHIYKTLLDHNFPDTNTEAYFNFSPKNWRTAPTYNLKDWTGSPELTRHQKNFQHYLSVYLNNNEETIERTILSISDTISLDDYEQCYRITGLIDTVNERLEGRL